MLTDLINPETAGGEDVWGWGGAGVDWPFSGVLQKVYLLERG